MICVEGAKKHFTSGVLRKHLVKAVDGVSFSIKPGETFGLVGESGCGKSTLSRLILRLLPLDSGKIFFEGEDISNYNYREMLRLRRNMQIIFQHPDAALNPRHSIQESFVEPIRLHKLMKPRQEQNKISELLEVVGLNEELLNRYPHQVSGGQLQRIALARVLTMHPKFLVLDEPTSMLDVSVQAQILNLLLEVQEKYNLAYLFISHDLEVVKFMSNQIGVMYQGKIVELTNSDEIFKKPRHPYTKKLADAFTFFNKQGFSKEERENITKKRVMA